MLSHIPFWLIDNTCVFVRTDFNIPLEGGIISNDFRLQAAQPTIDLLFAKEARIIIGTHIDRPHGYTKELSTEQLVPWFQEREYSIEFAPTLLEAQRKLLYLQPGHILLLENLRFFEGEKQKNTHLAHQLAALAPYYVNDAFALAHRSDTSVTVLPHMYPKTHKTIGLLIERELAALHRLKVNPERPFLAFIGGGKIKDKLPYLEHLLSYVDSLALCPGMVFTFLKAQGFEVGKSLVEDTLLDKARHIIDLAHQKGVKLLFPLDYYVSIGSLQGPLVLVPQEAIPTDGIGMTVGPKTLEVYNKEIAQAGTLFLNGAMGLEERPETLESFSILLQTIAQSPAYSVIGGGESVAAVYYYDLTQDINFCSTGGGATLAYLSHTQLPGLAALE
jgi:phosphoglycerate kinase